VIEEAEGGVDGKADGDRVTLLKRLGDRHLRDVEAVAGDDLKDVQHDTSYY